MVDVLLVAPVTKLSMGITTPYLLMDIVHIQRMMINLGGLLTWGIQSLFSLLLLPTEKVKVGQPNIFADL